MFVGGCIVTCLLDYAMAYASGGFEVLPLVPSGKRPMVVGGVYAASSNEAQIRSWWGDCPTSNIGLRVPKGCILLDVDPRNGGSLEQIGDFGRTAIAATGGGGWHLLYRFDRPVKGLVEGAMGVEIKGRKQYFVAAPSLHPSGLSYRWIDSRPPADLNQVAWSRVGRDQMESLDSEPLVGSAKRWAGIERAVRSSKPGNRNSILYWALRRATESNAPASVLRNICAAACAAGLPADEVDSVLHSALGVRSE